jgi:hypothetical protein
MVASLHDTTLNTDQYTCDESSNYSVFATSFTNVDGTNLVLDIQIGSKATVGQALVGWHCNVVVPGGQRGFFNVLANGTLAAGNDGIVFADPGATTGTLQVSFTRLVTGLAIGTLNRVYLQAKVTGGTMTVLNGAGTSNADVHPQFFGQIL